MYQLEWSHLGLSCIVLAGCYLLYRILYSLTLPRPIPGNIPYDPASAKRPFGNIPELIEWFKKDENPVNWFAKRCRDLNSPIIQVFVDPFSGPAIVVSDCREAHDIIARRTREFDRAKFFGDMFVAIAPNNQVCMKTTDQWHSNRRLMADTMSPAFLNASAAPQIRDAFDTFVELWQIRADLAEGRPFDAEHDVDETMLDSITAAAFGTSSQATPAQLHFTSEQRAVYEDSVSDHRVARFPRTPPPAQHTAIETIVHSSKLAADSLFGHYYHTFALNFYSYLRTAVKQKDIMVKTQLHAAWEKFSRPETNTEDVKSAAELIVSREVTMARKEGRKPNVDSPIIRDELIGFLGAGYDTTATTIKWGLKFLTRYQHVQQKLRTELRTAFAEAAANGVAPSTEDIARHRPAYLDAVIEEILRCGNPGVTTMRTATVDTEILGHFVPKGCDVLLLNIGPSYTEPPLSISESVRSKTSQQSIDTAYTGDWDEGTLGDFLPERWLARNERGDLEFNPRAGPQQTFGGGLRGCFGRRLAYVALRIVFVLLLWNFELQPLPDELGSFDAKMVLTHTPKLVYVKLARVKN